MSALPASYLTATETIFLVRAGKLTITEIAEAHLARYDERDSVIHAWAYFDREYILREAKRLDAIPESERGPLYGAVLGIKDVIGEVSVWSVWGTCE